MNRTVIRLALTTGLIGALLVPSTAFGRADNGRVTQRETLRQYASDTWRGFVAMTYRNGLTADNMVAPDNVTRGSDRSRYTSPTNIATYIWSALAARDLHIITRQEARSRIARTLETLQDLERHEESGMYYNWYDPKTGEKLTVWPVDGGTVYPFLSSVDNGWLAAALIMAANADPRLRAAAEAVFEDMDFAFYYDIQAGLLRGGYWPDPPPGQGGGTGGPDNRTGYTGHHYGSLNTEPRIASYIGIAYNGIPATHYFKMWRTFPATCDWGWHEMQPEGVNRTYLGVDVYEGHYTYRGMDIVPTWGGSMFEALMVPLLVPEEKWGARSWGINHPLYVRAQIEHGLEEAGYGYWGFSPSNDPAGGYREYGVDQIGLNPDGYSSDQERTTVDLGFGDCRPPGETDPEYGQGVVTPHASFLALDYEPEAALANLARIRDDFDAYGQYGFYDAVNVATGQTSKYYLALDQGMIMAAIANELRHDSLQRYFKRGEIREAIKPLLEMEEFTAGD
ncbi:MAG: DUF3131 domain-containing protein [Chloroflexota bacterium]|nr:DUF3131 domain-containing protein [Chloroflexota bacterium]